MALKTLFFSFEDIQNEWKKRKKRWAQVTLVALMLPILAFFLTSVTFTAKATFKEEMEKEDHMSNLKDILGAVSSFEPKASVLMKSKTLLRPVVEKLGWQAQICDKPLLQKVIGRLYDNLLLLFGGEIKDRDAFLFRNVKYEGEKPLNLQLQLLPHGKYALFSGKRKMGEGELFEPFHFEKGSFTLYHLPKRAKIGRSYHLRLHPWLPACEGLAKSLLIESDKINKSILKISFKHRDRWQATAFVNEMMNNFKEYLHREQEEKAKAQIAYLERRQASFKKKWKESLQRHVSFIKENIQADGFFGYQDRLAHFVRPLNSYTDKLLSLQLEDSHLEEGECAKESPIYTEIQSIKGDIESLSFKKNLIANSLPEKEEKMNKLLTLLEKLQLEEDLLSPLHTPFTKEKELLLEKKKEWEHLALSEKSEKLNKKRLFEDLQEEKQKIEKTKMRLSEEDIENRSSSAFTKDEIRVHLQEYEKLLDLKEKTYKERLLSSLDIPSELEGIELETASQLVGEYQARLDSSSALKNKLELLRKQLSEPSFDAASLIESVRDPISHRLLGKISSLQEALHDRKNHSKKELARTKAEIASTREFLQTHLIHLEQIEQINQDFIQSNMHRMQKVIIDRINQKMAALLQQEEKFLNSRKKQIQAEKKLLMQKIDSIKSDMQFLPTQWFKETMLKWQTELSMRMMESITKILESKTISSHLHNISSKPLDYAFQPLEPNGKNLLLKMIFFVIVSSIGFLLYLIIHMQLKGFTPSLATLQEMDQKVVGSISKQIRFSPFVGEDFESIRSSIAFLTKEEGKKIALFSKDNEDFTSSLSQLLAKMGYNSLVCSLSFSKGKEEAGLLQYLQKEVDDPPIQKKEGYDYLASGGISSFGVELISSPFFLSLLKKLERRYDYLIFHCNGSLESMQAKSLLPLVEKALVCYEKEKTKALQPFMDWGYIDTNRVAFIKVLS